MLFLPVTPGSLLANTARKVVEEEGRRLGVNVKVVERAGTSLRQHLVKTDLGGGGLCPQGDCVLCLTNPEGGGGLKHHRCGALYTGTCLLCPQEEGEDFTAVYTGESGDSGYERKKEHRTSIEKRDTSNAFAKHLAECHPTREGQVRAFKFQVVKTFRRSLARQIWEAVRIHGCRATIVLNSQAEWHQPMIERVVMTKSLPE